MKHIQILAIFLFCIVSTRTILSQSSKHENPIIANEIPDIPEQLFESGKLSKYVTLSLPGDEQWNPDAINLNTNSAVYAISQGENFSSCYIGGHFDSIGGVGAKRLAYFDDYTHTFSEVGGGVEGGDVYSIIRLGVNDIYVAGNFKKAGNINANCIAHWNGVTWETYGEGTDSTILCIAFVANSVYIGGNFHHAGGIEANYIARLDTATKKWSAVMDGVVNGMDGGVAAMVLTFSGNLYAGGGFTKAGSISANKIAYYNGSKWVAMQTGVEGPNAFVSAIYARDDYDVTVGGSFQTAGGISANNIATWNTNSWQKTSNSFDGPVYAIARPSDLFVGGEFHNSGIIQTNSVAKLSGIDWEPLGSGLDGPCYALSGKFIFVALPLNFSNHLYVGGLFSQAGLKPSQNFAVWGESVGSVNQKSTLSDQISFHLSPNPIRDLGTISFNLSQRMNISISVVNQLGQLITSFGNGWYEAGAHQIPLNVKDLPAEAYFCRVTAGGQSANSTFVVIR